ncbi:MAG: hypothetical protein QGG88_01435 [Gammaproteobacteria bacterium]|nr:hypothetical protein [Gammaproteobacteria bacterium]
MKTFKRTNRDDAINYIGKELIRKVEAAEIKPTAIKTSMKGAVEVAGSIRHGCYMLTLQATLPEAMAKGNLNEIDWSNIGLLTYTFEVVSAS